MKRIRTADGGLLFLEEDDYMPKLLAYLRETAGNDAADAIEEWASEQTISYAEVMGRADGARYAAEEKARRLFEEMRDERDEHLREIEELEEELQILAEKKEYLSAYHMVAEDLLAHPEKQFPPKGTKVWRINKAGVRETGVIEEWRIRYDERRNGMYTFFRIRFDHGAATWFKRGSLNSRVHVISEEEGDV